MAICERKNLQKEVRVAREEKTQSRQRSNALNQYGGLKRTLCGKSKRDFNEEVFVTLTTSEDIL